MRLALLLLLAGCAAPAPRAALPPMPAMPAIGLSDPARATVALAVDAFAHPARLSGNPEAAARAVARLEWLAEAASNEPSWEQISPVAALSLATARQDARAALGIRPDAQPAFVITALDRAAERLRAGDQAQAAAALNTLGSEVLPRLSALPPLPRAQQATAVMQYELNRMVQDQPD
jgi:hypothetical protein